MRRRWEQEWKKEQAKKGWAAFSLKASCRAPCDMPNTLHRLPLSSEVHYQFDLVLFWRLDRVQGGQEVLTASTERLAHPEPANIPVRRNERMIGIRMNIEHE